MHHLPPPSAHIGRHIAARYEPRGPERVIVLALDGLVGSLAAFTQAQPDAFDDRGRLTDQFVSECYGQIIDGIRQLLNIDTGRLDPGAVEAELALLAVIAGYCLDCSEPFARCGDEVDCDDHRPALFGLARFVTTGPSPLDDLA